MGKTTPSASRRLALVFDDPYDADEAKAALHRLSGERVLVMEETAVVVKHPDGKIRLTQDVNVVEKDKHVGHVLGLMAAAVTGTMPFIMAGTLGGELLGKLTDHGVTNSFIKKVGKEIQPGTSALLLPAHAEPEQQRKVVERLQHWQPRVLESDLPPEVEAEINSALRHETAGT